MVHPVRWKLSLIAVARLYLNGGDLTIIRGILKHLNVLFNTQLATKANLGHCVAVLEALTKRVNGVFDHHGDDSPLTPDMRMTYVEMQLTAARRL